MGILICILFKLCIRKLLLLCIRNSVDDEEETATGDKAHRQGVNNIM